MVICRAISSAGTVSTVSSWSWLSRGMSDGLTRDGSEPEPAPLAGAPLSWRVRRSLTSTSASLRMPVDTMVTLARRSRRRCALSSPRQSFQ